jgi:hypothetical protein
LRNRYLPVEHVAEQLDETQLVKTIVPHRAPSEPNLEPQHAVAAAVEAAKPAK